MHPVVKHLLARANKRLPFHDSRKIVLVLPGGLMTGVRGVGAVMALEDLGLRFAFDEIHAISAGVPTAIGFMSGQGRTAASIYWEELEGRRFINFLRAWKIVDIDYLMDVVTNSPKKLDVKAILAHPTKLYVRLFDTLSKKVVYLEAHEVPENEFMGLMRAATSMPYFHPGQTNINGKNYVDPDFKKDQVSRHLKKVLEEDSTDVVIIYNNHRQYKNVHRKLALPQDRVLEICPKNGWRLSRFETNGEKLKIAATLMWHHTMDTFGKTGKKLDLSYEIRS